MIEVLDLGYVKWVTSWGSEEEIIASARMSTQKEFEGWGPRCSGGCERRWFYRATGEETVYWGLDEGSAGAGDEPPSLDAERGSRCSGCGLAGEANRRPGDEKLLRYLWEHEHRTPFEMAGATFEAKLPIFVAREWQRHRVPFGYNEASARYALLPDESYLPSTARIMAGGGHLTKQAAAAPGAKAIDDVAARLFRRNLRRHYAASQSLYEQAAASGVPKELARLCLPVARYTRMRVTGNLRGWIAFLKLRLHPTAQAEIREYAEAIRVELTRSFPRTLALFEEERAKHG